jgi:hypothetical protein
MKYHQPTHDLRPTDHKPSIKCHGTTHTSTSLQAGPLATSHVLQGTWQLDGGPGVANNPQLQMMTDRLTWIRHLATKMRFFEI